LRRKKEEGRRKKEEGRRKKEEGRRKSDNINFSDTSDNILLA
jgi:hypothetical protein